MNEKEFKEIYSEFWENMEQAPDKVRNAYKVLDNALESYLCAVEEWIFRNAFEFTMNYAADLEMKKVV